MKELIGEWKLIGKNESENEAENLNAWMFLKEDGGYILEFRNAVTGEVEEENRLEITSEEGYYEIVHNRTTDKIGIIIFWENDRSQLFIEYCKLNDTDWVFVIRA